ncbi:metabolite traffic protein EboE [Actinoplanes teichomyceticus]|uniref:Xylose isomerase-like TIM barrel protein n=1 Tax=Actinoplanes teichomyceticus TaxID=1867 RepID=A0A561WMJ2_ACTTI|nr:metabolite traffic protein EboE [Actinoplanes teichomyceticus]TWG25097.1 xylose isomerase-like TIM barrel protein [Actinoplanes teichomyceticus]GIF10169.1 xylose isomerase [Actinoplanes teichomyceticus]
MRLRHVSGGTVHVSYCTNVHPAEDLPGIVRQLDAYAVPVRQRLDVGVLGLGLWLAAPVAAALARDAGSRRRLRAELDARGLEVVTLNGFPYRAFHAPVVKHAVYHPDWTTAERLDYTLDLARVLVDLLPGDVRRGSISTLPLAWRKPWRPDQHEAALAMLDRLAGGLAEIGRDSGREVRVGFEPEPGCVVETTAQAARLFSAVDRDRLGVCLDLAHLACAWEEPAAALDRLAAAGLPVVKVQVSAALEVTDPVAARQVIGPYAEPRFLHQTRSAGGAGTDDLDLALAEDLPGPWRVHFHVPLHAAPAVPLASTTPVLEAGLRELMTAAEPWCDHLDVETYTWDVLPPDRRPGTAAELADGIAGELAYTRDLLGDLGLRPAGPVEANR